MSQEKNVFKSYKMKCIEYFNKNNIVWGYIHLDKGFPYFKINGEWHPYIAHYNPLKFKNKKFHKKYISKEYYIKNVVQESQKYPTDFITYQTDCINSIDIDCPDINCQKLQFKCDYLLSKGRRLPHFFCKITNASNLHMGDYRTGVSKIDILTGQASYCRANEEVVINSDSIREIDMKDIYKLAGKKVPKKKENDLFISSDDEDEVVENYEKPKVNDDTIYQLFNSLSNTRYEDFNEWFKIMSFIKFFHDYEKGLLIGSMLSKKSTLIKHKMDYQTFAELYEKIPCNKPCSINTFLFWLKEDNPKKYQNILNKFYPKKKIDVEYQTIKEDFEKIHFHVKSTNNYYKKLGDKWCVYNNKNFRDLVADYDYTKICNNGNEKDICFFNKWIRDKTRKSYHYVDFIPKKIEDKNIFNEFEGFKLDTNFEFYDFEAVDTFLKHIKYICNGEEDCYNYFILYLAHLFQKPWEIPEIAFLIKSIEGCGKDLLIDILQKILGDEFIHRTSDLNNVFGTYNSCLKHKIILQLNEVQGSEGYKVKEGLKDIITRKKHPIQEKYCSLANYSNFLRVFIFSNNKNPICIGDNDRRFFVLRIEKKKSLNYYKKLAGLLDDTNALQSILKYFMGLDISKFNIRDIPMTKEKKQMTSHNRDYLIEFLQDNFEGKTGKDFITGTSLLHRYSDFLLNNNFQIKVNSRQLKSSLSYIDGFTYKRKSGQRGYMINYNILNNYLTGFLDSSEEE